MAGQGALMRHISQQFIQDLNSGTLKEFLELVTIDDALCLEIRGGYINIYYRGGNLFKISPAPRKGGYRVHFDVSYAKDNAAQKAYLTAIDPYDLAAWVKSAPLIKAVMDGFLSKHPKLEREFQQLIERENNSSAIAQSTDYFIVDIEYANSANRSRFDMLAVKWLRQHRQVPQSAALSFIEVKYGDKALKGKAGIRDHVVDIVSFLKTDSKKSDIINEVNGLFSQKRALGLLGSASADAHIPSDAPLEFILLVGNHTPASSCLDEELAKVAASPQYAQMKQHGCQMKIAVASLMGYGLYDECMIPLEDYLVR
jgi:hypothetical protein